MLMQIKNLLFNFLVRLLRPFLARSSNPPDRFLIVSTTGLGDTLWGTPAIRALRNSYPKAYITILTSPLGKEVLQNNPHIDEFFAVQNPALPSLLKLFFPLRQKKFRTILIFHTSQRPVLPFCALLGAQRIIGTANINKGLDFILTEPLENRKQHEIQRRLEIVQAAGAKGETPHMDFFPSVQDRQKASTLIPSGCVIGLHPGAKDRFKQWPPSHFITLGRKLKEKYGCEIVITGTPAEKELVEMIAKNIGALSLCEGVTLSTFAAVLDKLSLFITNDTGPLHMACASKTPTIALFTPTDPLLCGPYGASHVRVIQKKPTCFPCLKKKCQEPFCLLQISPNELLSVAEEILQ